MAEGKTIDVPSVKCESCEEADSSKFCTACNQPLCTKCTQIHARLAPTKHHKPISIEEYRLLTPSTKKQSQGSQCAKHPSKLIEKLCDDCLVVLCSDCEPDHKSHTIHQGSLDVNFLHRLSAQKIPGLLEIIQQLRDFEDGSPEKIKLYQEAERLVKSWKDQLLDRITKEADKLLCELRDKIRKLEKFHGETLSEVKEYIVKADQQITTLSESRKISDVNTLLDQLSKCDTDIEDVKAYLEKIMLSHDKIKIEDILPHIGQFNQTITTVQTLFTKSDPQVVMDAKKIPKITKLTTRDTLTMVLETSLKGKKNLGLCGTYLQEPKFICLFRKGELLIEMFDKNLQATSTDRCSTLNLGMISLAPKRFVSIGYNENKVYLLDERFKDRRVIYSPQGSYYPRRLHAIDENLFMVCETNTIIGSTRFKEVSVHGDSTKTKILCEVQSNNLEGLMACSNTGVITFADTFNTLTNIDIRTRKSIRIHNTANVITSICGERNGILFGDDGGNVHKIEGGTYKEKIIEGLGSVTGILSIDSGIVVLAGDKLQLYQ